MKLSQLLRKKIVAAGRVGIRLIKSWWKWLLLIAVIALLVAGWFYRQQQQNRPRYTFAHPQRGNLTKVIQVSGVVDAQQKASLRFANGGKVVYLNAKEGELVTKGQTLATIDRRELEKRLQQDLNSYLRQRWDWEGLVDEYDYHVETLPIRRMLDQEQWRLDDTVLNVEIRDIAIQNTVLSAPFGGILVSAPLTSVGVHIAPTDSFEVVDPNSLIFKAGVDESDIHLVRPGQTAQVALDAYPDAPEIATQVRSIAYKSSLSSTSTVFVVEFPLEGIDDLQRHRLGMNGDVSITVDQRQDVLYIPLDATRQRDGVSYVDVKVGGDTSPQITERELELGMETDADVEVISGLTLEDEIVIP